MITELRFDKGVDGNKMEDKVLEDQDVLDQIEEATHLQSTATDILAEAKEAADELKEEVREILDAVNRKYGLRGVKTDEGNLTFYYGTQSRLDKAKLQERLVVAGVKQSVVVKAIKEATKTTTNANLTVTYKKAGG